MIERLVRRLVALAIDLAVGAGLFVAIAAALYAIPPIRDYLSFDYGLGGVVLIPVIPIVYAVYFTVAHGRAAGQTIGKRLLGLRVRSGRTGGPLGYGSAFIRFIAGAAVAFIAVQFKLSLGGYGELSFALYSVIVLGFPGSLLYGVFVADVAWPLIDRRGRALHDLVASSVVERCDAAHAPEVATVPS